MHQASLCRLHSRTPTAGPAGAGVCALPRAEAIGAEARDGAAATVPDPATDRTGGTGKGQRACRTGLGDDTPPTGDGDRHPGRTVPGRAGHAARACTDRGRR